MVKHSQALESKLVPQWKINYIDYVELEGS